MTVKYELGKYDESLSEAAGLTQIQDENWRMWSEGFSTKEIAESRGTASSTVAKTRKAIHNKLSLLDSPGIIRVSREMGIDTEKVKHGWMKTDEGSFFFGVPREDLDEKDFASIIKDAFEEEVKRPPLILQMKETNDDLLSKYVLADLHLGMYAWAEECGEDYDSDIAEELMKRSIDQLAQSVPNSETALVVNLGDFFHANDAKGMTPFSGHILDMDTRFARIASTGVRVIRYVIETLAEKHAKVKYVAVPGNHDPDQSVWLTLALMEAYRDQPNVEIVWNPGFFYATQHGNNMIAAHHGDRTNFQRLVLAMSENYAKMWGDTYWRFLDTGHVHHQREQDIGGVLCRSYRTLAAKDAFHAKGGYSSKRSITAQTYHKTDGEILVNNVHIMKGETK